MASTNKTTNYELSQYVGSDKPTYLGDYNADMLKIDTAMKANNTLASNASTTATTASETASTALTNAGNAQTTADSANSTATSALSKATTNEADIATLQLENQKNIVSCSPSENYNTVAASYTTIPLAQDFRIGDNLTISNNAIKVGDNIDYVEIEAKIGGYITTGDTIYFFIQKNGENVEKTWTVQKYNYSTYFDIPITTLIPVIKNDLITITVYTQNVQRIEAGKTEIVAHGIKI